MLQGVSENPIKLLGVDVNCEPPKPQLPTKRKREELCGLGNFNKLFTIKPHPESPYARPAVFKPVRVIGRSQLPLTFLDTTPDEPFANNSLFGSHIDVLEDDVSTEDNREKTPRVLVARYDTKRTLYAIERVQPRIYSICRLASWLKEKDVAELWDPASLRVYPTALALNKSTIESKDWWKHATVEAAAAERPSKRVRMTMMRKEPTPEPVKEDAQQPDCPPTSEPQTTAPAFIDTAEDHYTPPLPQEQLESLVQQYLDALYMSKTSLAYFAKGPMTRIRNAFTSPEEGAAPIHELVTFLRSMILSLKAGEKKYFEKLPAIIKALPPSSLSDEEQLAGANKPRKTKKKIKLSREGLYSHEEAIVKKWWFSDAACGDNQGDETLDQRIKRRIGELRVRETLAQVILMLEIVALEALATFKPVPEDQPSVDETQPNEETRTKPKTRKKKLDDIGLQLEFLLDRLGIWHDTGEAGILNFESQQTQQHDSADGPGKGGASDRLREFCIEVVNPFYMNRLPEQARIINKKLGGPAHTSPSKRKAMRPPAISRKSGEAREPEAKKSRRSLARVATDTMRVSTDRFTPALSRSATDSALIKGIKREGSEAPLSAIPFSRSPSRDNRRSMSHFQYLAAREVDLTTPSATATAKLKQKKRVDEEVKEAITALRKPNRGLAVGGYVDENERRGLGPASRSRKQPNPVRRVGTDVQVSQTPKVGRRTKNMVEQTPTHHDHHSNPFTRLSTSAAPPSSDFCIPSSGVRRSDLVPGTVQRSATGRKLARDSIAETPSKAPSTKAFESGAARRTIFATPSKANVAPGARDSNAESHIFETPAKVIGSSPFITSTPQPTAIAATPTKPSSAPSSEVRLLGDSKNIEGGEPSIYAALGWDDEDDDLL